jgi:hypothetical protein
MAVRAVAKISILPTILARMVGSGTEDVTVLLDELEGAGVFSRTADGVIFSRRMINDEKLRQSRAAGGVESLNNPNVPRSKDDGKDTFKGSMGVSFEGSPSSSKEYISPEPSGSDDKHITSAFESVWHYYLEKTGRNPKTYSLTPTRKRKGLSRLHECLKKTNGDVEAAVSLMKIAVDALADSDWHMGRDLKTNGKKYCEWEDHLFKSYEQMEKWWNR